jgi:formylmethanofuran:tetrahydromethanopterin formyltransferase
LEAARRAAGETGLAQEAGPEATLLAGGRGEVLGAMARVIEAALEAGARAVEARVEAQGLAQSFDADQGSSEGQSPTRDV